MIKLAAILHQGIIYKGKRHREIIDDNGHINLKNGEEGFVTSQGLFVDREQAARIAHANGQIKKHKKSLKSEDLW